MHKIKFSKLLGFKRCACAKIENFDRPLLRRYLMDCRKTGRKEGLEHEDYYP